jgi:hypothetical protein
MRGFTINKVFLICLFFFSKKKNEKNCAIISREYFGLNYIEAAIQIGISY